MRTSTVSLTWGLVAVMLGAVPTVRATAADLQPGPVELRSAGPLAMTDSGELLVGDPMAAVIYAIDLEEKEAAKSKSAPKIDNLHAQLAKQLGAEAAEIQIGDLATHQPSGNTYLSVSAGDEHHLVRISPAGEISKLNLDKVLHAKKSLPNPPADEVSGEGRRRRNLRSESITDLAFSEGKVLVSGLSATASPSSVMEIPFPFSEETILTNVEIFHAAHGRVEDDPAIRTFVTLSINGEPNVLAGFTCTPLVAFPIDKLGQKETVRGKTLAELGNRNRPLDMIAYQQNGEDFLLISNSARGLMKVSMADVENNPGLSEPVRGGGAAGQPYETVASVEGVVQMDRYDEDRAIVITQTGDGASQLRTIDLP